jgi:phospholipase/lecithinase/hemolysin
MKTHVAVMAAWLLSFPLSAANLLTNPHFDANVSGWTSAQPFLTATWNGIDASGSRTSGSVTLRNTWDSANGGGFMLTQCVPVTAGSAYDVGAKMHIGGNQGTTGLAGPTIYFFDSLNCTGSDLGSGGAYVYEPTGKFIACAQTNIPAPAGARSALVGLFLAKDQAGGVLEASFDDAFFGPTGGCVPTERALCLANGRFRVETEYQTPGGETGAGRAIQLTSDSGYFWFFGAENVEMIVKALNACQVYSRYWIFSGGLTNVRVTMTVEDTVTHQTRTYENPQNKAFAPIQDTNAFATCP